MSRPTVEASVGAAKRIVEQAGGLTACDANRVQLACQELFRADDPRVAGAIGADTVLSALVRKAAEMFDLTDPRGSFYDQWNVGGLARLANAGAGAAAAVREWASTDWLGFFQPFGPSEIGAPLCFPMFADLCIKGRDYRIALSTAQNREQAIREEIGRGWRWRHRPEDDMFRAYRPVSFIVDSVLTLPYDISPDHTTDLLRKFGELETTKAILAASH